MVTGPLEEEKKKYNALWTRILDEWFVSAQKATDSRPDYKWAQEKAEKEFAATLGADFGEDA